MNSTENIGWFADIGLTDRPQVGGKGGSLGELQRAQIAVPPGFVIKVRAFDRFLEGIEREAPLRARVETLDPEDLNAISACCLDLRVRVESAALPQALLDDIAAAHAALCGLGGAVPVAVRSSATTEDASDASFAGLQDTYLWVTSLEDVLLRVRTCWASLYSVESVSYRRKLGMPENGVSMAVVIQKMVNARTAGVMFTRSPLTGDRSVMAIEAAWGLGSAVVGGEVTPDRWVVGKITGEITVRDVSDKQIQHVPAGAGGVEHVPVADAQRRAACLSDDELQALRVVGRKIEKHYGCPQDIEWAVESQTNQLFVLQSRPETVWSTKDTPPIAAPAADPLLHVMAIFGGRG